MSLNHGFELFVAGKTGAFKGVKLEENGIFAKNLQSVKVLKPQDEISVLRWDDDNECNVLIGTVGQCVKVYDTEFKAYSSCIETKFGSGVIVGLSRFNSALVTCTESGHVKVWRSKESGLIDFQVGGSISCMKPFPNNLTVIATGGKQNDLKLWDIENKKAIFLARNVKKDMLELEVPIWVTDIQCIPNTEYQVVVSTKYGQIRLYDTRAQRRPVFDVNLPSQNLNTLALCANNNQIVTGSCTGFMLSVDIRGKGKVLHSYKGAVGSIRQIASVVDQPYIASVGLDRYLRIHHLETRKLLHQKYLKVRLNAVIMRSIKNEKQKKVAEDNEDDRIECVNLDSSDDEYNEMFHKMDTIIDESHESKKQKLC